MVRTIQEQFWRGIGRLSAWLFLAIHFTGGAGEPIERATAHWAFQPPVRPALPTVKNVNWVRTKVDLFLLHSLEQNGLSPSPEADKRTLLRRVCYDLTGLPPSPEVAEAFLTNASPRSYEELVEQLVSSPRYGERWGRHWLDVAGYADSNGYFDADTDRPLAYKYRDYVIWSINADKPFDQFIREQIAGDELAGFWPDGDITPEMTELLTATHFFRNAPDGTGESDGNPQEQRVDRYSVLEGNVQLIGSALLGMTVQCGRCHDHKFEPFSQEEYYQLQAILRPAYNPEKWIKPNERAVSIGSKSERESKKRALEKYDGEIKALKEGLDGLLKPLRRSLVEEKLAHLPEEERKQVLKAYETKEKERSDKMKELLKQFESAVQTKDEDLFLKFAELKPAYEVAQSALKQREANRPAPLPQLAILAEPSEPSPAHHILLRGNHHKTGKQVEPGVPVVFCKSGNRFAVHAQSTGSSGRRTAFANWITSPDHPTFARLIVNRVWQRHFGTGIVPSLDNFGLAGAKPSHPQLLDWLATEFVRSGWSLKALHRLIVNSAAYRQKSAPRNDALKRDPENRLLWRYSLQRMDAESIRDAILLISGELDLSVGGPYVPRAKTEEGQYVINDKEPGARRRSLYLQQKRGGPVTLLDVFDGARMNPNCVQRPLSTVPLQSLAMLNSEFVRSRSKAFARRLLGYSDQASVRLSHAFELAYGGHPTEEERIASEDLLRTQSSFYEKDAEVSAWTDFCQMLFSSNPFLYIE